MRPSPPAVLTKSITPTCLRDLYNTSTCTPTQTKTNNKLVVAISRICQLCRPPNVL
ncbi:hypothetical protein BDZ97DRAFT_511068 [Flammula alnicola]|nr:hypothetical protein BDZ97DRAFT_511068 [Flammula alnicola]